MVPRGLRFGRAPLHCVSADLLEFELGISSKPRLLGMLVLKRREGQWIDIIHKSGDVLRFRVYNVCGDVPGRVNLAFDDDARNFEIQRPERAYKGAVRDRDPTPDDAPD